MITKNQIYSTIVDAVQTAFPSAYCAGRLEPIPDHFPAVYIRPIGISTPAEWETLEFDGSVWRPTFEIQIFSNKENDAGEEAYAIASTVSAVMKSMYFLCDLLEPIENIDPSVFRLVGRWHRLIGGADDLPEE